MVLVLKDNATEKDIEEIEKEFFKKKFKKGFDAKKYNGLIPTLGDPLEIQKKLRNEWERNIG